MRTATILVLSASVAFAATWFVVRPKPDAVTEAARPMTLAGIQARREAHRGTGPVHREVAAPVGVSPIAEAVESPGGLTRVGESIDRSMVGLPFQVSESVDAICRRDP